MINWFVMGLAFLCGFSVGGFTVTLANTMHEERTEKDKNSEDDDV